VTLLANGIAVGTATASADGSYSVAPSTALAGGPHTIKVSVPDPADPTLALESGTLNISLDVTAPATTIATPKPTTGTTDATPTRHRRSPSAPPRPTAPSSAS
jgi:hypothetical protein